MMVSIPIEPVTMSGMVRFSVRVSRLRSREHFEATTDSGESALLAENIESGIQGWRDGVAADRHAQGLGDLAHADRFLLRHLLDQVVGAGSKLAFVKSGQMRRKLP